MKHIFRTAAVALACATLAHPHNAAAAITATNTGSLLSQMQEIGPGASAESAVEIDGALTLTSPREPLLMHRASAPVFASVPAAATVNAIAPEAGLIATAHESSAPPATLLMRSDQTLSFDAVTPVPEPATWMAGLFGFAFVGWHVLRRLVRHGAAQNQ